MLNAELAAKIAEEVKLKKKSETTDPDEQFRLQAKKAAAKKLMTALKSEDDEAFLQAMAELKEIDN